MTHSQTSGQTNTDKDKKMKRYIGTMEADAAKKAAAKKAAKKSATGKPKKAAAKE